MAVYDRWKETQLSVTNLLLDPHNPRIPDSDLALAQRELLADLVENDDVYGLAKSIVDNGYYPVESLIIVEDNTKKFVVEGNRRLAALKLLLSPDTAPEEWKRRFRALSNRVDPDSIKKVKVVIAPSREAAAPVIMSKHTQRQVESWSPLMQAKFYKNLSDSGLSIDDISQQFKVKPSEITDARQRLIMYGIACSLDLPDEIKKSVHNPREFPVTTLDRLYKNSIVSKFLGIEFDRNKDLLGKIELNEFKKGYAKIVTDIATGKAQSRKLNNTKDIQKYLDTFGEEKPNLEKKGNFDPSTFLGTSSTNPRTSSKKEETRKKPRPPRAQLSLIPSSFTCEVNNQRINDVFNELKKIRVSLFPNSVGLMIRSLLEMSVGYYLDRTGHLATMVAEMREDKKKKNQNLPKDWHPTLTQMLDYIVNKSDIIKNGNIIKSLNKLISDKTSLISIDSLNLFVHNQHFYPNEDTLKQLWAQLEPLFEIILVEPDSE